MRKSHLPEPDTSQKPFKSDCETKLQYDCETKSLGLYPGICTYVPEELGRLGELKLLISHIPYVPMLPIFPVCGSIRSPELGLCACDAV